MGDFVIDFFRAVTVVVVVIVGRERLAVPGAAVQLQNFGIGMGGGNSCYGEATSAVIRNRVRSEI